MLAPKSEWRRDRRRTSKGKARARPARRALAKLWRQEGRSAKAPKPASRARSHGVDAAVLVLTLGLGSYAGMLAFMWLTFARTSEGVFLMLVVTLVFVTFVAVPLVILRLTRENAATKSVGLREYLKRSFDTLTGPLAGGAALVQIIVVPALLTLCLGGIAIAIALAR